MVSPSVSTHRGLFYWQGLLLVVSLLNFWSQPTAAQVTVESRETLEGMDVTLWISPKFLDAEGFLWYKGRNIDDHNLIAYLSRNPISTSRSSPGGEMMVKDDGSLLLKNVSLKHSGFYTVVVEIKDCQKLVACGQLHVYPLVTVPILAISRTTATENKHFVIMTCFTDAYDVEWFFNGISLKLTERMRLSHDHRVLTIHTVKREDAGDYQCKGFNPMSSGKTPPVKLNVKFE